MHFKKYGIILLMTLLCFSCKRGDDSGAAAKMGPKSELVFARGEKITNDHFIGNTWVEMLVLSDSINRNSVGSVTFEPGARTNWHSHPNGQIILAIEGTGYYQEKGSPKRILKKGDAVKCPPNIPHWHGASDAETFVQIAITSRVDGPTQWLDPVSEAEYN